MSFKKSLAIYGGADLLAKSIGLVVSPILTRLFTLSQFGAQPLLLSVWAPFGLFQYGGMDVAYPFFKANSKEYSSHQELFSSATFIAYGFAFLTWLVFFIAGISGSWLARYAGVSKAELVMFMLTLLPLGLVYWICYILRYLKIPGAYVRISLIGRIMPSVVSIPILLQVMQGQRLFVYWAVSAGVGFVGLIWACIELRRLGSWPFQLAFFSRHLSGKLLRYGLVLVPSGMFYALIQISDRLLVGFFMGPENVAVLTIALMIGSIGTMLTGWFGLAFDPHLVDWIAKSKREIYLPKMQLLIDCLSCAVCILACTVAVWSHPLINLLYPDGYNHAANLAPWIVLASAFVVLSRLAVATVMIAKNVKYHALIYFLALMVNLALAIVLIPEFGLWGAVISTLFAELWILLAWVLLGKKILKNLPLKWTWSLTLILLAAAFLFIYERTSTRVVNEWSIVLFVNVLVVFFISALLFVRVGRGGILKIARALVR